MMAEIPVLLLKTVGLGLLTGFVFGFLFKKVAKIVLFLLALGVVLVVVLGHNEILDIDWLSTTEAYQEVFKDRFDEYSSRLRILMRNAPFAIGVVIGALIGLKKG